MLQGVEKTVTHRFSRSSPFVFTRRTVADAAATKPQTAYQQLLPSLYTPYIHRTNTCYTWRCRKVYIVNIKTKTSIYHQQILGSSQGNIQAAPLHILSSVQRGGLHLFRITLRHPKYLRSLWNGWNHHPVHLSNHQYRNPQ